MAMGKLRISMMNESDELYDFPCSPCFDDGKNTEGLYQCIVCQMYYCQHCVKTHNKFTKNHNVLDKSSATFGQAPKQPATDSSSELPTALCEEHHGEVVKMFCGQHDMVCCTVCVAIYHRSCKGVEYIPKVAKGLLQGHGKDEAKSSLETVKSELQILKLSMQNDLKELYQERDEIIDDIQRFKKRIIAKVEEYEKKSLHEVHLKHKEISEKINAFVKRTDDMLKEVEVPLNKLKQSKKDNDAQTFVDIKNAEATISLANEYAKTHSSRREVEHINFKMNTKIESCLSGITSLGTLEAPNHLGGKLGQKTLLTTTKRSSSHYYAADPVNFELSFGASELRAMAKNDHD